MSYQPLPLLPPTDAFWPLSANPLLRCEFFPKCVPQQSTTSCKREQLKLVATASNFMCFLYYIKRGGLGTRVCDVATGPRSLARSIVHLQLRTAPQRTEQKEHPPPILHTTSKNQAELNALVQQLHNIKWCAIGNAKSRAACKEPSMAGNLLNESDLYLVIVGYNLYFSNSLGSSSTSRHTFTTTASSSRPGQATIVMKL